MPGFHNSVRSLQDGSRDELGWPGRGSPMSKNPPQFPSVPPGGQEQYPKSQRSWCRGPSGWRSALLQVGKLLVPLSKWSLGVAHMTTGARFLYTTTGAGCTCSTTTRDSKTGAVTNKGGADSAGRGAAISTTSTISEPPGGQVQCPNSQASGSQRFS